MVTPLVVVVCIIACVILYAIYTDHMYRLRLLDPPPPPNHIHDWDNWILVLKEAYKNTNYKIVQQRGCKTCGYSEIEMRKTWFDEDED